jgi:hypothetical protein
MLLKPRQLNIFLLFKLPAAFLCGVRVKTLSETTCITTVRHKWINKNPFGSLYWAVQGMGAELSTGALVMSHIKEQQASFSMLVAANNAVFTKKAKGRINFSCHDGEKIKAVIDTAVISGAGQTCLMKAEGTDEQGDVVSVFEFEWTVKLKS